MGVLRFNQPGRININASLKAGSLTSDMISTPLSPDFSFDTDVLPASLRPALEYISTKLLEKSMHVTLLVGRGKPFPTGEAADLLIMVVEKLNPQQWKAFYRIVEKGARKFSLGRSWTDALESGRQERGAYDYLVQQSIKQNTVLFSQEGLTVLDVDRIYTFKRRLYTLSLVNSHAPEGRYIDSCVSLLRQMVTGFQGRPFSKAFFHRVYDHLQISDDLLVRVAETYKQRFGLDGIIVAQKPQPELQFQVKNHEKSPSSSRLVAEYRVSKAPGTHSRPPSRRGPKTPVSASDVTPITRNEWNILVGHDFWQMKPTVTMWIPSPVEVAG